MRKLLLILALGLFILAGCDQIDLAAVDGTAVEQVNTIVSQTEAIETETPEAVMPSPTETSETPPGKDTMAATTTNRENEITIQNAKFNDDEWVIHEYAVIKWTNLDDVTHRVAVVKTSDFPDDLDDSDDDYDDDAYDDSGEYSRFFEFSLSPGQSFTYTFEDDGRYEVYMDGLATVAGIIHVSDDYLGEDYNDDYDDEYDHDYDDDYDNDYDDDYDEDSEDEGTSFLMNQVPA